MRQLIIITSILLCLNFVVTSADDPKSAAPVDWKDITSKIAIRTGDQQGFTEDAKAKIYKDPAGMIVKVTTSAHGELYIELKDQKVYSLQADGSKTEIAEAKLKQRNRGIMLVIITGKFRIQATMTEIIPGMSGIPGLTAM